MSQNLPNMLQDTISKIREMVDVNNVIGEPIVVGDIKGLSVQSVLRCHRVLRSDHHSAGKACRPAGQICARESVRWLL